MSSTRSAPSWAPAISASWAAISVTAFRPASRDRSRTEGEEFPFFREFWIETPGPAAERVTIYGLLDGASITGAYRFDLYPGNESVIEVSATLFPRRGGVKMGLAPLTSMFFTSQNDRRFSDDFRPELHDSDGLLIHSGTGEWIWRPLRNPLNSEVSAFLDKNIQGFGLLQRDRVFEDYQDLDLAYELRPSYWIEPKGSWARGGSNSSNCPRRTKPTIISSPPGCRTSRSRPANR